MSGDPRDELAELARLLQTQIAWQRDLGAAELPRVASPPSERAAVIAPVVVEPAIAPVAVAVAVSPSAPQAPPAPPAQPALIPTEPAAARAPVEGEARRVALSVLDDAVRGCTACKLAQRRTQTVFARGNPFARVAFIGEGPGEQEDKQGVPFVGPAGQLLDKIIVAMGLDPAEVYVCNVVKCRPPGNRTPELDEVTACTPFLAEQLELVRPEVIVSLGRTATGFLLGSNEPMGKLRGRWHAYRGVALLPTWHPSYLLREPVRKAETWSDMKIVMERLGLPLPPTRRG
jgi:DNA polymerase